MNFFVSKSTFRAAATAPAAPAAAQAQPPSSDAGNAHHPLPIIASSFTALAARWQTHPQDLAVLPFAEACDHISVLFHFLGVAFSFGGKDYIDKVSSTMS